MDIRHCGTSTLVALYNAQKPSRKNQPLNNVRARIVEFGTTCADCCIAKTDVLGYKCHRI